VTSLHDRNRVFYDKVAETGDFTGQQKKKKKKKNMMMMMMMMMMMIMTTDKLFYAYDS
jgi:hypothetical protein